MKIFKKIDQKWALVGFNTLEFFDLFLFIHLASIINPHFLGDVSPTFQKIFQFSSAYLITPLALIFFAHYADKMGRKPTILKTTSIVVISSIGLGFLGCTSDGGMWGAILYMLLRAIQAIGMAGEPMAAKLYAVEDTEDNLQKIPFWVQFLTLAQNAGGCLALLLGISILTFGWDWRIALIIVPVISVVALYIRQFLSETQDFQKFQQGNQRMASRTQMNFGFYDWKYFFRAVAHVRTNLVAFAALCLLPFITFIYNYVHLTPHVLRSCGLFSAVNVMWHNLGVAIIANVLSTITTLTFYKKEISLKKLYAVFLMISVGCLFLLNRINYAEVGATNVMILQGLFHGFLMWNIIYGQILRGVPVNWRFKFKAYGWSFSRLLAFVFAVWVCPYLVDAYGIEVVAWTCGIYMVVFALPAALISKDYKEISKLPIPAEYFK